MMSLSKFYRGSIDIHLLSELITKWAEERDEQSKIARECREKKMFDVWRERRGHSIGVQSCIGDLFDMIEEHKEFYIPDDVRKNEVSD